MNTISRRELLKLGTLACAGVLAACAPKVVEVEKVVTKEVEKLVTKVVEVEKVVKETVIVAGTPKVVERVVKETVVVEVKPAEKEPVEIVFALTESADSSEALYRPIYEKFTKVHPEISVKFVGIVGAGGWGGYFDKLAIMIAGGDVPDMAKIPTEGGRLAAARGFTVPLDPFIAATPELDDYFQDVSPELAEVFVFGGKTYGLPYDYNNMMIWFNTKRLEEEGLDMPPEDWTFSDFVEYANALTRKEGDTTTHYGFSYWWSPFGLCPWLFNNGLEGIMGGAALEKPLVSDPKYLEVIQYLYDLTYTHGVAPRMDAEFGGSFEAGTVAMMIAGRWPMSGFLQNEFYDYEVQYWPKGVRQVTEVGCGSWPIFAESKKKEAAWAWEVFLLSRDSIAYMVSTGANIPSRRSVGYHPDFTKLPAKSGRLWYESIDREDIPVMSVTSPPISQRWRASVTVISLRCSPMR